MLAHVVRTAQASRAVSKVCLVGPSRQGLPDGVAMIEDVGGGLNAALSGALTQLARERLDRIIVLAADLPQLATADLDRLAATARDSLGIAPDRHGTGTNALSLPMPAASDFRFMFGTDSFRLHGGEAKRLTMGVETIITPGLARDIDEPADLPDAMHLI